MATPAQRPHRCVSKARDATLSAPRLLLPSIQVNIRAGKFPPAHVNGVSYLTIPVKFKNAEAALG